MTTECRIFRNAALSVDFCVAYLLEWQCEGLKCRISNKKQTPTLFFVFCGYFRHNIDRNSKKRPLC